MERAQLSTLKAAQNIEDMFERLVCLGGHFPRRLSFLGPFYNFTHIPIQRDHVAAEKVVDGVVAFSFLKQGFSV
jgi:hypothetical protein